MGGAGGRGRWEGQVEGAGGKGRWDEYVGVRCKWEVQVEYANRWEGRVGRTGGKARWGGQGHLWLGVILHGTCRTSTSKTRIHPLNGC